LRELSTYPKKRKKSLKVEDRSVVQTLRRENFLGQSKYTMESYPKVINLKDRKKENEK
jgi:hypothetical protein